METNLLELHLSPDDLVYVPNEDERQNIQQYNFRNLTWEWEPIYKIISFTGKQPLLYSRHRYCQPQSYPIMLP